MKNRTYLVWIFLLTQISIWSTDQSALRNELLRQIPQCDSVAENAARLLLNKSVPETEVMNEWQALCPGSTELKLYRLALNLNSIDASSPEIDLSLWTYINANARSRRSAKMQGEFKALTSKLATNADPQSTDGKVLRDYFVYGYHSFRSGIKKAKSGKFLEFYRQEAEAAESELSLSMGLIAGAWIPRGNLARLGNHPSLGFDMYVGYNHFYFGIIFDFRFLSAPSEYTYYNPNTQTLNKTVTFFSLFFGPDFRWQFFKQDQFAAFLAGGLGYDLVTHLAAPRYSGRQPAFSDSFNINGGLAMRYYFSDERRGYTELAVRYHRARFSDGGKGGDDIAGDYVTITLAIGYRLHFNDP